METKNIKTEMILDTKSKYDFFVKVVVVGDIKVGKTSILKKVLKNEFIEEYKPTNGYEFNIVLIKVNEIVIKFQIWDMSGEENYRPSLLNLYRNANLGFLVYSVSSRESFNNLEDWIDKLRKKAPSTKIILIGNKCDEKEKREVSYEEGKELFESYMVMVCTVFREVGKYLVILLLIAVYHSFNKYIKEYDFGFSAERSKKSSDKNKVQIYKDEEEVDEP